MTVSIHHLRVPRSARYALLGGPGPGIRQLWMVLHGYRQLAPRFIRGFEELAGAERWIAAPEALNRFYVGDPPGRHGPECRVGGTWMTREDREAEIQDYVGYLDRLHDHLQRQLPGPVPVVALGFSQGCHTVARWAVQGRARPGTLILWGGTLPADLDPDRARRALEGVRIVSVQGAEDPYLTPQVLERERERSAALGLTMEVLRHGSGHRLEPGTLRKLAQELLPASS